MRRRYFLYILLAAGALSTLPARAASSVAPVLHLAGDSTMADKPTDPPNPEHGWGQMLPKFFRDPSRVINHAMNGRSTKSFIDEGRWQELVNTLNPGDFVIIQFGHNDEKKENPAVYADAHGAYRANLLRFIQETRQHGATPILATSVVRRKFDASGKLVDTHGDYPGVVRELAATEKVPLLELEKLTAKMEQEAGPEKSKLLHLWIPANTYVRQPKGWQDDTHYSELGATQVAALAVDEFRRLRLPLVSWLK